MCKSCGKDIYTVAEVVSKDSIEPLHAAGVEDVICIETVISPILVQAMLDPGVGVLIEQLVSNRSGSQYYVGDISFLAGKSYQDIQQSLANQSHLRVIPIALAQNGVPTINPEGSTVIQKGDTLFYIANKRQELEKTLASLI
jgi:Trk K+ transport system NAD-binding subunit